MTATTATTVMTPMMTPRSVRAERSLCAAIARHATRRSSPTSTGVLRLARLGRGRGVVDLDPVADLQGPEGLEGARDDLVSLGEPFEHLDLQLGREPRLDLPEVDRPVLLRDEDPFDLLLLPVRERVGLLVLRHRGRRRVLPLLGAPERRLV